VLGATKDLHKITLAEWQGFIDARTSGAIDAAGEPVPPEPSAKDEPKRRRVGARAVENDCVWLQTVLRWATAWQGEDGKYVMRENPARGDAFRKAVPHAKNPRRPVATQDRLDAILEAAPAVHPFLVPLLHIINGTGRRIRAVLALRFEDVRLAKTPAAPARRDSVAR
jgi:hypothetical protein